MFTFLILKYLYIVAHHQSLYLYLLYTLIHHLLNIRHNMQYHQLHQYVLKQSFQCMNSKHWDNHK